MHSASSRGTSVLPVDAPAHLWGQAAVIVLLFAMGCGDSDPQPCAPGPTGECKTEADAGELNDSGISDGDTGSDAISTDVRVDVGADAGEVDCRIGSSCATVDRACLDGAYPVIDEWVLAGVSGGVPEDLEVVRTVDPSADLQSEIDAIASGGGGVLLLRTGNYPITETLRMKTGVVLRGEDRDTVRLESTIRSTEAEVRAAGTDSLQSISFGPDVANAALENLTVFHQVDDCEPPDDLSLDSPEHANVYVQDPCGMDDLYTVAVEFAASAHDNWIDGCAILESMSHAVRVQGSHNTIRGTLVSRAYNKNVGAGGAGYFGVYGDHNLIFDNDIERIRHLTIAAGRPVPPASYNVIFRNRLRVDVNFHDGDEGSNLVEQNSIMTPSFHPWSLIDTGGERFGHRPPGPDSFIYNNMMNYRESGEATFGTPGVIYTLTDYETVVDAMLPEPSCGTFYPIAD